MPRPLGTNPREILDRIDPVIVKLGGRIKQMKQESVAGEKRLRETGLGSASILRDLKIDIEDAGIELSALHSMKSKAEKELKPFNALVNSYDKLESDRNKDADETASRFSNSRDDIRLKRKEQMQSELSKHGWKYQPLQKHWEPFVDEVLVRVDADNLPSEAQLWNLKNAKARQEAIQLHQERQSRYEKIWRALKQKNEEAS